MVDSSETPLASNPQSGRSRKAEFTRDGEQLDTAKQNSTLPILIFAAFVAILVTVFKFPPLLDYPNHYARLWLLAGGIGEQPFPAIYAVDWNRAFTNLGIDLMAWWLGPVIGISLLARILLFLAIVLPPVGAIALHRRLFGGAYYWQIAMLYFAWCATLIGGFINFQIGLGMALLAATIDDWLQAKNPGLLFGWRLAVSLVLTITHIFSVGFYLALICGLEFSWRFDIVRSRSAMLHVIGRLLAAMIACALPVVALMSVAADLPGSHGGGGAAWNDSPALIIANLLSGVWTYSLMVDMLLLIPIILVCSLAIRTGRMRLHAGLAVTAAGLLLLACASPRDILGTGWISWRFPIMCALAAMAMICPLPHLKRREAIWLAVVLNAVVFGRTGWISYNWWAGSRDIADIETILAKVPQGAAVISLKHDPDNGAGHASHRYSAWGQDTFRHIPTLAVPLAHAFVPTLFTAKGKQPLALRQPWADIAVPEGNLFSTAVLVCPEPMKIASSYTPYLVDWRKHFDFLLVVNADLPDSYVGDAMPQGLNLVGDTPFAKLYAIDKTEQQATVPPANCPAMVPG